VEDALLSAAPPRSADDQCPVCERQLCVGWIDSCELDDDDDNRRILRAIDVHGRTKPSSRGDEPRNLAEICEKLLHLGLEPIHVLTCAHETIVPMGRIPKVAGPAAALLLYVWFAAVRNADRVKERKRSRHPVDARRSLH
jgi:hypothetical protein